jgi:hypothetical protein
MRSKREACDDQRVMFGLMNSFSARDLVAMTVSLSFGVPPYAVVERPLRRDQAAQSGFSSY